jgi:hypothetical protein
VTLVDTLTMCDQCCHMVPKSELMRTKHSYNSTNWRFVDERVGKQLCKPCAFAARLEGRL